MAGISLLASGDDSTELWNSRPKWSPCDFFPKYFRAKSFFKNQCQYRYRYSKWSHILENSRFLWSNTIALLITLGPTYLCVVLTLPYIPAHSSKGEAQAHTEHIFHSPYCVQQGWKSPTSEVRIFTPSHPLPGWSSSEGSQEAMTLPWQISPFCDFFSGIYSLRKQQPVAWSSPSAGYWPISPATKKSVHMVVQ